MKTIARPVLASILALTMLMGIGGPLPAAQSAPPAAKPSEAPPPAATPAATTKTPPAAPDPAADEKETFAKDQLEQLVAPIALYPDALLIQIMMAATYPLEVVGADRWLRAQEKKLEGEALEAALKEQDWDPSVKGLCTLPDVLKKMSDNLDWMQDLGDAFLGQKDELLDTVQDMRAKADKAGTLKSTEQQSVTVQEDKIIVIESKSPEVVYVPTYSPSVVYGGWGYSSWYYPPMYPYYPYGAGFVAFGAGVLVGAAIWGGCGWGRGRNNVYINHHSYNNFNRNTNINHNNLSGNRGNWNHNPSHRGGVSYQNSKVAGQYGAKGGSNRVNQGTAKAQSRGHSGATSGNRASATGQSRTGQAGSGQRASASTRSGSASGSSGRSAYGGSSNPNTARSSSSRGSYSTGNRSYGGSYGGGRSYGGGMRGGGGGRRR